jgi:hypothetical protein
MGEQGIGQWLFILWEIQPGGKLFTMGIGKGDIFCDHLGL